MHGRDQAKKTSDLRNHLLQHQFFFALKRAFDFLVSSLLIIFIFSWLFPLMALLIKLDSSGPIFFIQKRAGFLGRPFMCLKFRTMYANNLSDEMQATHNDPRITRLGKIMRLTSLDELPQFFNVWLGQMSIVGPRPHMYKDNENFSQLVTNYRLRSLVKPGITGMAQVKGYRGPAKDFYQVFHRYQFDAFYFRNMGFSLDMKIVRLTAIQMLRSLAAIKWQSDSAPREMTQFVFPKTASSK